MPSEYTGLGISCVVYLWDFQPAGRKSGICTGWKICLLFRGSAYNILSHWFYDTFYTEYTNATSSITEEKATEIANNVFETETNLTSTYNKDPQTMEIKSVHPTNLFIRKYYETDYTAPYEVTAYCFRRSDDMGNGTEIYIDNKLGKVIGGYSFGD